MASAMVVVAMWVTGAVAERPIEMDDRRPIGNYWVHLRDIVKTFPPDTKLGSPLICDRLKHLRAKDLIRAASQGAAEARIQSAQDAARGRQIGAAHAGICFEFFPLLAERDSDFNLLLSEVSKSDGEPAVRICLLQAMSDWSDSASGFSKYCTENLRKHSEDSIATARIIAGNNSTLPETACAALEMGLSVIAEGYKTLLREDPAWQRWIGAQRLEPSPAVFRSAGLPRGGVAATKKLETLKTVSKEFLLLCERKAKTAAPPLQDTAARARDRIRKDFPELPADEPAQSPSKGARKPG